MLLDTLLLGCLKWLEIFTVAAGEGGGCSVAEVRLGREESFDNLLKRFSKRVQQEGLLSEYRRRRYFEKPSVKRKRKQAARLRRAARR